MTSDEYINILRDECHEHLSENKVRELDALFASNDGRRIFLKLEELRVAKKIPSPRFEKTLTDFYWRFCN